MTFEREYLSEMDIFKVISEGKSIKLEAKVYPEEKIMAQNDKSVGKLKSFNNKLGIHKDIDFNLQKKEFEEGI